jgi:hypothetical protein
VLARDPPAGCAESNAVWLGKLVEIVEKKLGAEPLFMKAECLSTARTRTIIR